MVVPQRAVRQQCRIRRGILLGAARRDSRSVFRVSIFQRRPRAARKSLRSGISSLSSEMRRTAACPCSKTASSSGFPVETGSAAAWIGDSALVGCGSCAGWAGAEDALSSTAIILSREDQLQHQIDHPGEHRAGSNTAKVRQLAIQRIGDPHQSDGIDRDRRFLFLLRFLLLVIHALWFLPSYLRMMISFYFSKYHSTASPAEVGDSRSVVPRICAVDSSAPYQYNKIEFRRGCRGGSPYFKRRAGADPRSFAPNRPPHIHIYAAHDRAVQDVTIFVQEVSYDQPRSKFRPRSCLPISSIWSEISAR